MAPEGPLVVDISCIETDFCDDAEPEVEVRAEGEGALRAGTTTWLRGAQRIFLVWTPAEPLAIDTSLAVTLPGSPYESPELGSVRVGAPESPPVPDLEGAMFCLQPALHQSIPHGARKRPVEVRRRGLVRLAHARVERMVEHRLAEQFRAR